MYQITLNLIWQNRGLKAREPRSLPNFSGQYSGLWLPIKKWCLLLGAIMFLNACSSEFEEVSDYPNGRIAISVSNDSVYLSEVGSNFTVSAKLLDEQGVAYVDQPQFIWTSASTNVVSVDANGLITANAIGQTTVTVSTTDLSSQMQVVVSEDVVTLNGTARYEDREYGATGFITQQSYYKAIRHAKVVVVDANGEAIGGIAPVYTDANGKFVIAGLLNTLHYIRISAITDSTLGMDLAIKDRQNALYSISKQVDIQRAANFTMDVPLISDASGAFNILDVFVSAAQFTLEHTALPLVSLSAYWEPNNSDGTYFCNGHDAIYCDNGKGIYIFNSPSGDTDEYDDDVLFHEFGHYFAQTISRDDSYGGCHVLSSTDLDLRLSWSEGWGDFFPAAVKSWLANDVQRVGLLSTQVSFKTAYIDTYQNSQQIFLQLDATLSASIYKSAGNELAVAKILLSLYDRYGMKSIVDVLTGYLPDVATPVNLESFWDGWLAIHSPNSADKDVLKGIYNERSVFYQEDVFEADNAINPARKINLNIDETHYLYSEQQATDIDYVAFDTIANNQYTLSTGNLTSGADTYIRVLNADGTPLTVASVVVENDDADESAYYGYDGSCGMSRIRNNATALSSRLTFIAPATGTYYAELRTTVDPAPYFSAGRYGTFTFKVVQN